eukprot:1157329-Pelagomonas_calceolata.AAC.7
MGCDWGLLARLQRGGGKVARVCSQGLVLCYGCIALQFDWKPMFCSITITALGMVYGVLQRARERSSIAYGASVGMGAQRVYQVAQCLCVSVAVITFHIVYGVLQWAWERSICEVITELLFCIVAVSTKQSVWCCIRGHDSKASVWNTEHVSRMRSILDMLGIPGSCKVHEWNRLPVLAVFSVLASIFEREPTVAAEFAVSRCCLMLLSAFHFKREPTVTFKGCDEQQEDKRQGPEGQKVHTHLLRTWRL